MRRVTKAIILAGALAAAGSGLFFVFTMQPVLTALAGARSAHAVDPRWLEAHVRMLSVSLAPRDHAHPRNLDRAADYLRTQFSAAGGRVSEQVFSAGDRSYRNVIVHFGPPSDERIVVGAHYDAAGEMPGADDNASGVAGLIELAHLLGKAPPPIRTELVAYSLEEPPHYGTESMGSAVHAAALKRAGVAVKAMICLEMIGYFDQADGSQRYPFPGLSLLYPTRGDFIAVSGDYATTTLVRTIKASMIGATELPVRSINGPAFVPGVAELSDHMNYRRAGYRAVMVSDTAYYRNPHYHLPSDTADTLDYRRMAQVVQGVYAAVIALGG